MPNFTQIIKEFATFLGKRMENVGVEIKGAEVITLQGKPGEPGEPGENGSDGHTPSAGELLSLIKPLIPEVKDGKTPTSTELMRLIKPLIPKVKDGETPTDTKLLKLIKPLIPKPIPGTDGSPDTGEEIIAKINQDKSDKLIRKGKIEGFDEFETRIKTAEVNSQWRGGGSFVHIKDLSSSTDGTTKTFTVPAYTTAHMVLCGDDLPHLLMLNNGFTATATTITLTTATAPSSGSQLAFMYSLL